MDQKSFGKKFWRPLKKVLSRALKAVDEEEDVAWVVREAQALRLLFVPWWGISQRRQDLRLFNISCNSSSLIIGLPMGP